LSLGSVITLIGSLIGALAASLASGKTFRVRGRGFSKEAIAVTGLLLTASGAVVSSIQQARSGIALAEKNEELLKTSQSAVYGPLGGASPCVAAPVFAVPEGHPNLISGVSLTLRHQGDLPCYDVRVTIRNDSLYHRLAEGGRAMASAEAYQSITVQTD